MDVTKAQLTEVNNWINRIETMRGPDLGMVLNAVDTITLDGPDGSSISNETILTLLVGSYVSRITPTSITREQSLKFSENLRSIIMKTYRRDDQDYEAIKSIELHIAQVTAQPDKILKPWPVHSPIATRISEFMSTPR